MQLKAAEYYPGLTRRIYLKGYRYNMHLCPGRFWWNWERRIIHMRKPSMPVIRWHIFWIWSLEGNDLIYEC